MGVAGVRVLRMIRRVTVGVIVSMRLSVGVRVIVSVTVGVVVRVVVVVRVPAVPFVQPELGCRQADLSTRSAESEYPGDDQAAQRSLQFAERKPRVKEGAEHHVARGACETIEVEDLGHRYRYPDSLRLQ